MQLSDNSRNLFRGGVVEFDDSALNVEANEYFNSRTPESRYRKSLEDLRKRTQVGISLDDERLRAALRVGLKHPGQR
jgi:hypothetical protein